MQFQKRILVLKQVEQEDFNLSKRASAITRIECEDGIATLFLSVINLAGKDCGEYYFYLVDGNKKIIEVKLGSRPTSLVKNLIEMPDLTTFSAGICYILNDIPQTIVFASSENSSTELINFKKSVAERCLENSKIKKREHLEKLESQKKQIKEDFNDDINNFLNNEESSFNDTLYNDEAVATENYYLKDQDIDQKIKIINGWQNDENRDENELSINRFSQQAQAQQSPFSCLEDEADLDLRKEYNKDKPYYDQVKNEIQQVLQKFKRVPELESIFQHSTFVKINYDQDKFYVVGIIPIDQQVKYICYGVPGKYSKSAPQELKGYCSFIPLSLFNLKDDGYWMMFQSAISGECLKFDDNNEC